MGELRSSIHPLWNVGMFHWPFCLAISIQIHLCIGVSD